MLERSNPIGEGVIRRTSWGRRIAGLLLAYLFCFASILSVAQASPPLAFDPLHAAFCASGADGSSSSDTPAPAGHDHDLSCCLVGGAPVALPPDADHGAIKIYRSIALRLGVSIFDERNAYPLSAHRNSRAPPRFV